MRNKCEANHVLYRDGVYYYVRRVPYDLTFHYDVKRLCFSLKTKSASAAVRASKSINQRLEDYWLGLRLQNMDIPAIQVVRSNDNPQDNNIKLSQACELYRRLNSVGIVEAQLGVPIPSRKACSLPLCDIKIMVANTYPSFFSPHPNLNLVPLNA